MMDSRNCHCSASFTNMATHFAYTYAATVDICRFERYAVKAKEEGINVIVISCGLGKTSGDLMSAANFCMDWNYFVKAHYAKQRSVTFQFSPEVRRNQIP